jgi:hypothetical protein
MICPRCGAENEMAYSVLSYAFVCLENTCGFEVEMEPAEAIHIARLAEELTCV